MTGAPFDHALLWPIGLAGDAVEALARATGLEPRPIALSEAPAGLDRDHENEFLEAWIEEAASCLGLEAQWLALTYVDVEVGLRDNAPLLLAVPGAAGETRLLAIARGRRGRLEVICPAGARVWIDAAPVLARIRRAVEEPLAEEIEQLFRAADLSVDQGVRAEMLRQRLGSTMVAQAWTIDLLPGARMIETARRAGLPGGLAALAGARIGEYVLLVIAWWLIGRGALAGEFDGAWLVAWALTLACSVGLRLLAMWAEGELALRGGVLVRRRSLVGALRLEPEEVRSEGAGQLLGRVVESEALETLSFSGGLLVLVAAIELLAAEIVLSLGAGGTLHAAALGAWVVVALLLGRGYLRRLRAWTALRLDMTHDLVERMAGHATRLAQQRAERLHDGEDPQLEHYIERSSSLDRRAAYLTALVPRGWMIVGIAGLAPAFVSAATTASLAIALGGLLLAHGAFQRLVSALPQVAGALAAWSQVGAMFRAAAREQRRSPETAALIVTPRVASERSRAGDVVASSIVGGEVVIDGRDLVFQYRREGPPVLRGCDIGLATGDRVLLEGPSGGGKSTLAAVLAGLRQPDSGLLTMQGFDHRTFGPDKWRRRVAAAPQFHENHILNGTLLFNLLLSRRWPPRLVDRRAAKAVCVELGLDRLLAEMPSGLDQIVGETGWQLSHGERSRVYLARALLQGADVVVLDESFAALDPDTLERAVKCARSRATTLVVIAHP
jgi:ATP-binding cassette subfamily B protein